MKLVPALALAASFACSAANAADFSFVGSLARPGEVQLFSFNVGATSDVTLRTWSYAGGTNAAGALIPRGGFDPILALFDSTGLKIGENDDGGLNVAPDPVDGIRFDTFLFLPSLAPGAYQVSVAVFPNFAIGPNLSNGFSGADTFNGRTADWAFDVLGVDTAVVATVPVPAALPLMAAGLGLFGFIARRRRSA